MTSIAAPLIPPLVIVLLPFAVTTLTVMAYVLFILRMGWGGYRALIGFLIFTGLAFWAIPTLLHAVFITAYWSSGGSSSVEVILWIGLLLSALAILLMALGIWRTGGSVPSSRDI